MADTQRMMCKQCGEWFYDWRLHVCTVPPTIDRAAPGVDANPATDPLMNPWHPMSDPVDLKHIGKLIEELGEAVAAASRCLIQGIDKSEPVTGKHNREWLEDELADVDANIKLCIERFNLSYHRMYLRTEKKMAQLRTWHDMA